MELIFHRPRSPFTFPELPCVSPESIVNMVRGRNPPSPRPSPPGEGESSTITQQDSSSALLSGALNDLSVHGQVETLEQLLPLLGERAGVRAGPGSGDQSKLRRIRTAAFACGFY